jgi:hypothetical protein
MKARGLALFLVVAVLGLPGCTDIFESSKPDRSLRFENASSFTVTVISQSTQWGGVTLAPGERVKIGNVRDLDYRWFPPTRVVKGGASSDRDVIFVNAPPSGT